MTLLPCLTTCFLTLHVLSGCESNGIPHGATNGTLDDPGNIEPSSDPVANSDGGTNLTDTVKSPPAVVTPPQSSLPRVPSQVMSDLWNIKYLYVVGNVLTTLFNIILKLLY